MFWEHWVDLNRENESWALVSHDHKNLILECPHGCMHDQFCIKFPNHHCCMCVMEIMWDIPFSLNHWPNQRPDIYHVQLLYKPWAKIPTHHKPWPRVRMPILTLGRKKKFPIKDRKKKKENSQSKIGRKQKRKENSRSKIRSKQKKYTERSLETTTWSGPLSLITNQNLECRWLFRPALNKNKKGKGPNTQSQISHQEQHYSQKSPIDPWSRM